MDYCNIEISCMNNGSKKCGSCTHNKYIKDNFEEGIVTEKYTPTKPNETTYKVFIDNGWKYECPNCRCAVGVNNKAVEYTQEDTYCPSCGQKLDWRL